MAQSAPGHRSSVDLELALLQNRAVRVYAAALELRVQAAMAAVRNRQAGVAARRRIDVVRRQHQALMGRAAERLSDARRTSATGGRVPTRVVVAHRDGRFVADLQAELAKLGHWSWRAPTTAPTRSASRWRSSRTCCSSTTRC